MPGTAPDFAALYPGYLASIVQMTMDLELYQKLIRQLAAGPPVPSVEQLVEALAPMTIGVRQSVPLLNAGARLFRVTNWCGKPVRQSDVGVPPLSQSKLGRLNAAGQPVLYLADSPDTAFAEARTASGEFCISEWRVVPERLALANGGIPTSVLRARFGRDVEVPLGEGFGAEDEGAMDLLRQIFTQSVGEVTERYHWSIAGGLACGFAYLCERIGVEESGGNTVWTGRYPFGGLAYASTRADKAAVNFVFNDVGQAHLRLECVQWVARDARGSFTGLDFASAWDADGKIQWLNRPARMSIPGGCSARVVKVAPTVWQYEAIDGHVPIFN